MIDLLEHVKKRVKNNKAEQYLVSAEEYEGLLEIIEQQQRKIDELAATVERFRIAALNAISVMPSGQAKADLRDAYDDAPEQSLNALKRTEV